MAFSKSQLRRMAASSDPTISQLAVELLEAKAEVAACCDRIMKLGGKPNY